MKQSHLCTLLMLFALHSIDMTAQCAQQYAGAYGNINCPPSSFVADNTILSPLNDSTVSFFLDGGGQFPNDIHMIIHCDFDSVTVPYQVWGSPIYIEGSGNIEGNIITIYYHRYTPNPDYDSDRCKILDPALNTENITSEFLFTIYPNPTSENLNITFPTIDNWTTQIFSINGQLVKEAYFAEKKQEIMSVSDLPSGFYFIKLRNSLGNVFTKKISVE